MKTTLGDLRVQVCEALVSLPYLGIYSKKKIIIIIKKGIYSKMPFFLHFYLH